MHLLCYYYTANLLIIYDSAKQILPHVAIDKGQFATLGFYSWAERMRQGAG